MVGLHHPRYLVILSFLAYKTLTTVAREEKTTSEEPPESEEAPNISKSHSESNMENFKKTLGEGATFLSKVRLITVSC